MALASDIIGGMNGPNPHAMDRFSVGEPEVTEMVGSMIAPDRSIRSMDRSVKSWKHLPSGPVCCGPIGR